MFAEFREAWRQAVTNFWTELDGGGDGASRGAYREVLRVRTQLERLEVEIADTRARHAHEAEQVEVCARRERMARTIGDIETARVAGEYAARHRERADVLGRKLEALEAERGLCRRDLQEMERALQNGAVSGGAAGGIRPELDDLNRHPAEAAFRDLEDGDRAKAAEERLAELKRRMGQAE